MKERQVQNQTRINEIYRYLKSDLTRCIKAHRRNKPEIAKEYFNTENRWEIEKQLQVICKPFADVQKIQISKLIIELWRFYPLTDNKWQTKKSS